MQSFNAKALLTLASVIRKPYLMSPHVHVATISGEFACNDGASCITVDNLFVLTHLLSMHSCHGLQR